MNNEYVSFTWEAPYSGGENIVIRYYTIQIKGVVNGIDVWVESSNCDGTVSSIV